MRESKVKLLIYTIMGKITKVVVAGHKGAGKTAILEQVIYGKLNKETFLQSTIEDIYVANIETERGTKEKIRFYDTGSEFYSNGNLFNLDGYILVFDPSKSESLDWIINAKKDIERFREKKEITVFVLSNHFTPTPDQTVVSKSQSWAMREKLRIYDVCALERSSLYEPFVHLATRLSPPPTKSAFPQLSIRKKD